MVRKLLLLTIAAIFAGCAHTQSHDTDTVNHIVLIWLKDPGNPADRQQVIDASLTLRKIPGILEIQANPVIESDRPIVDDSFDVGVHMRFKDLEAMQQFTSHPDHIKAVKNQVMPIADKIVIYDF